VGKRGPKPKPAVSSRACIAYGFSKPIEDYAHITASVFAYYGRSRVRRNRRARERYQADPVEREAEGALGRNNSRRG
jgi:hypothetical protein